MAIFKKARVLFAQLLPVGNVFSGHEDVAAAKCRFANRREIRLCKSADLSDKLQQTRAARSIVSKTHDAQFETRPQLDCAFSRQAHHASFSRQVHLAAFSRQAQPDLATETNAI